MSKKEPTEEELDDIEEEISEEERLKQFEDSLDLQEEYDVPVPEERQNQHSFLHKAAFSKEVDSIKTTFLSKEELGKPIFTVRFLMEMEIVASYYLDEIANKYGIDNKLKKYFRSKILNITDSGMSNEGFVMNLNVTTKKDISRKRQRNPIDNLKGGLNNGKE